MKKLFLILCLLLPNFAFSLETALKGFIALDALNYEKIQSKEGAAVIGIGVLDLKVFAEQDYMSAAIKLDLDNSKLSEANNIFEEAYISYRGIKGWRFSLGKGIIKFQNLHWGVIENTYLDGGSLLGTESGWRKVSKKNFISATYGNRGIGFADTFAIFGESTEIKTSDNGSVTFVTNTSGKVIGYTNENVPAFNTAKEQGFANKLELYKENNWTLTTGQIYYRNKFTHTGSYAFDLGLTRDAEDLDIWVDLMWGKMAKAPFEAYSTYLKQEYFAQMGAQYHFNTDWSWLCNLEYTHIKDKDHNFNSTFTQEGKTYQGDNTKHFGQTYITVNYKIETGAQYNLSKSSFLTLGGLYEKRNSESDMALGLTNIRNANAEAFKLASTISFWF